MLHRMDTGNQDEDGLTQKQFLSTTHLMNTQHGTRSDDQLRKDIAQNQKAQMYDTQGKISPRGQEIVQDMKHHDYVENVFGIDVAPLQSFESLRNHKVLSSSNMSVNNRSKLEKNMSKKLMDTQNIFEPSDRPGPKEKKRVHARSLLMKKQNDKNYHIIS